MRAEVDQELCVGCGLCANTAPDVFVMDELGKARAHGEVTPDVEDYARTCEELCPFNAIRIE
ncbi:MAG: ferredoxin [Lachnospiraceae bacterium]